MRTYILSLLSFVLVNLALGQDTSTNLKMITDYSSVNEELRDILEFEGIEYLNIKFIGKELKTKSYHLTVKEVWDGNIVSDTTIINSKELPFKRYQKINDTVLKIKIISKLTVDNKLKMTFKFPRFSVTKEFDAINSNDYSLRNIAEESKIEIGYNKKFYFLAYILPYEREDGSKSWCDVGTNGGNIENWGKAFNLKHYLIFEMVFQ